jgi:hypothetical protein
MFLAMSSPLGKIPIRAVIPVPSSYDEVWKIAIERSFSEAVDAASSFRTMMGD